MNSQQHCSWQEVGEQLRIEVFFFNRDPQVLSNFLAHIEAQDAHPDIVFEAFKGFFFYLGSRGYDRISVAFNMRQTIGQHRLAHLALKRSPNIIDKTVYEARKLVERIESKGGIYFVLVSFLRAVVASISPFLLFFDYEKDIVLYLILSSTLEGLDQGCQESSTQGTSACLAASGVERDLITALLITFCLSLSITSLNAYHKRKRFFKTNRFLDVIFLFLSPLLPAVYQINQARMELEIKTSSLRNDERQERKETAEKNFHSIQQTKSMEVGLEAVLQIVLLSGLATFYWFVIIPPSGQSYAYFWGVALLVLKGNAPLFVASLFVSFVGPCIFYVNYTNILLRGCLSTTRKVVLLVQNLLFLLVRVLTIISAIFTPVINHWSVFIGNEGIDATLKLSRPSLAFEFQNYFSKGLDEVTSKVRWNAVMFIGFLLVHLVLVVSHALLYSSKFGRTMMRERMIHLVSSFWLPMPFLTRRDIDKDDHKDELWFHVVLHSLENVLLLLVSRWVYSSYPVGHFLIHFLVAINTLVVFFSIINFKTFKICNFLCLLISLVAFNIPAAFLVRALVTKINVGVFVADLCLVVINVLGVIVVSTYQRKFAVFAGVPTNLSDLPSFGPEVRPSSVKFNYDFKQNLKGGLQKTLYEMVILFWGPPKRGLKWPKTQYLISSESPTFLLAGGGGGVSKLLLKGSFSFLTISHRHKHPLNYQCPGCANWPSIGGQKQRLRSG